MDAVFYFYYSCMSLPAVGDALSLVNVQVGGSLSALLTLFEWEEVDTAAKYTQIV